MKTEMVIQENVTLEQIIAFKPKAIYYGANTCWWTHDAGHLGSGSNGLPIDPVGGVLFETDEIDAFFKAATSNPEHYGKHGLRAFIAAHHSNCFAAPADRSNLPAIYQMRHYAAAGWTAYNDAIDRLDAVKN